LLTLTHYHLLELQSLIFEVFSSEPAAHVASVVHSISLRKVTSSNQAFMEWATDFSSDVSAEIIHDSSHKRLEAFMHLEASVRSE
jgi:F0F1-type ATP synthase membrane subunit a